MPELRQFQAPARAIKGGDQIALTNRAMSEGQWATVADWDPKQVWGTLVTEEGDPKGTQIKLDRQVHLRRYEATDEERAAKSLEISKRLIQSWIEQASIDLLESGNTIKEQMEKGLGLQPSSVERRYIAERFYAYSRDLAYDLGERGPQDINLSEKEFYSKVLRRWQSRLTQEAIRELRSDGGSICYRAQNAGFAEALSKMIGNLERWETGLHI